MPRNTVVRDPLEAVSVRSNEPEKVVETGPVETPQNVPTAPEGVAVAPTQPASPAEPGAPPPEPEPDPSEVVVAVPPPREPKFRVLNKGGFKSYWKAMPVNFAEGSTFVISAYERDALEAFAKQGLDCERIE